MMPNILMVFAYFALVPCTICMDIQNSSRNQISNININSKPRLAKRRNSISSFSSKSNNKNTSLKLDQKKNINSSSPAKKIVRNTSTNDSITKQSLPTTNNIQSALQDKPKNSENHLLENMLKNNQSYLSLLLSIYRQLRASSTSRNNNEVTMNTQNNKLINNQNSDKISIPLI